MHINSKSYVKCIPPPPRLHYKQQTEIISIVNETMLSVGIYCLSNFKQLECQLNSSCKGNQPAPFSMSNLVCIRQNFLLTLFLPDARPSFYSWALQLGYNRTLSRDVQINSYY